MFRCFASSKPWKNEWFLLSAAPGAAESGDSSGAIYLVLSLSVSGPLGPRSPQCAKMAHVPTTQHLLWKMDSAQSLDPMGSSGLMPIRDERSPDTRVDA